MFSISYIVSILKNIDPKVWLLIVILLVSGYAVSKHNQAKDLEQQVEREVNNIRALQDSVRDFRNKAGELNQEKLLLQGNLERITELNSDLANEVNKLEETVFFLSTSTATIIRDTVTIRDTEIVDLGGQQFLLSWEYSKSYEKSSRFLKGNTEFFIFGEPPVPMNATTRITRDETNLYVVTGVREMKDGAFAIFLRTDDPNVRFTQIDGAILEGFQRARKVPRLGIGPAFGVGTDFNDVIPFVGLGMSYHFIRVK